MPKGTQYIDKALTNVAVSYKNTSMIAEILFPSIAVPQQSGKVYKFGKDAFRIETDIRAPGTVSNQVQPYSVSTETFFCDNHALSSIVTDEEIINADAAIDPEMATVEGLTDKIMLRREYSLAAYLFNVTTFSGYTSALVASGGTATTTRWDDYTNSDPTLAADYATDAVRQKSGAKANTLIIGAAAYMKLRRHPALLDQFKYTAGGVLNDSQLAEAMGVERILVGRATYNSAQEGATVNMADVWGKYALFAYIAPKPGLRQPSLGYSYRWNTGMQGVSVYKEYQLNKHGMWVEVMNYFDDIVHGADFGYLYSAVIS
jgi:hypothetical protein